MSNFEERIVKTKTPQALKIDLFNCLNEYTRLSI